MIEGPAGAFQLVGVELICGTFVLMWLTVLVWKDISRGHPRAITWVLFPLMGGLTFLLPEELRWMGIVTTVSYVSYLIAVYSQRPLIEWMTGGFAVLTSIWIVASAGSATCVGGCASGAIQSMAGALFLGAVTHGMVLGHWYLNQPRLPLEPLKGATIFLFGSLVGAAAVGVLGRASLLEGSVPLGVIAPSTSSFWWTWLILLALTGGLGVMIRETVWTRSTQSATGLLYVAMVPALGAQFLLDLLLAT